MKDAISEKDDGDRVRRLEAALELVWRIHVQKHMHLGLERGSGVGQHCIPCICAAALNRGMDDVHTDEFVDELTGMREDSEAPHERS